MRSGSNCTVVNDSEELQSFESERGGSTKGNVGTGYERSNEYTVKGVAVERSAVQFRTSFERLLPYIYILGLGRPAAFAEGRRWNSDR